MKEPLKTTGAMLDRQAVLDAIPGNWLDPILTGPSKVLPEGYEFTPRDVERVLNAIRKRIEALPSSSDVRSGS